jgi:tetratricopeptide (TPR) repeat protein
MCVAGFAAHAAGISASNSKNYGRVNFDFSSPAKLKASSTGTTAVLNFDKPLEGSPESIKAALPDYVSGASLSADKRSLTLTLTKPYRVRQFVTGNGVGIDLVAAPERPTPGQSEAASTPSRPKPEDLSAPASASAAPDSSPTETETQEQTAASPPPEPEAATLAALPAPPKAIASKKPASEKKPEVKAPAPAKPKPIVPAAPAATPPTKRSDATILSTKKQPPVQDTKPAVAAPATLAQEPVLTTKASEPEPIPVSELEVMTTKAASPVVAVTKPAQKDEDAQAPEPEAPKAPATAEPAKEAPAAKPTPPDKPTQIQAEKGPFIVSAKTANGETSINFPWGTRTAVALFRRGQDVWLIFSEAKDVNIPLLRTILPKQVVNVTQYAYPKNTVLRFVTDGTVFARTEQVKGRYGWNVIFSQTAPKPALDITVVADNIEGSTRLIFGAFDVAPELRFYDPNVGDPLIVIPAYENSRGVPLERNFPELSVLATAQGIAVINHREGANFNATRAGLIFSAKDGLAISESLPQVAGTGPVAGASVTTGVMIPYDQWYVPNEKYRETELLRLNAIANANKASKADALFELAKLYLAQGFGTEAGGVLSLIRTEFPQYYAMNKLALLSAAAHVLENHIPEAAADLQAPELNELEETALWREVVALSAPPPSAMQVIQQAVEQQTPATGTDSAANNPVVGPPLVAAPPAADAPAVPASKPVFHFLKYNKTYIRFYPPRLRQRLALLAGDAYLADGQQEKALAAYDTLVRDGLLDPVRLDAEFALGSTAEKKGELDQAYEIYDRLATQKEDRRIAARARYAAAILRHAKGKITAEEAADILENTRTTWRGDSIERNILYSLVDLYTEAKRYDDVLRSYKAALEAFPNDPDSLKASGEMSALFERVFLDGLAEEMQPLKSLSLFYEFRDLTPLGEKGDKMVQKLADRLAAIDLLERATQLLENQIKFRATGEARSQIGARLALLYLLNRKPQEALSVLEVTNYGGNMPELQVQRRQLTAEALTKLNKHEEALGVIAGDTTKTGALLRLDILWALQDWPSVVNNAEDILNARPNLTEPLSTTETEVLLKLALAYAFESDLVQLRYLRDYYSGLIPDSGNKQIFDFITNDTTPLDPEDFVLLAQQISRTESFLGTFRTKIAAGKLSEAIP